MKRGELVNLFRNLRDSLIQLISSRVFILMIAIIIMTSILIQRIFSLQIVNGSTYLEDFKLKIKKERTIASARGNIYDYKGNLLAFNELAYSVTIQDVYESGKTKNSDLNQTIYKLIHMIEKNGDKLINDFKIIINRNGQYEFVESGSAHLRFLADIYGIKSVEDLSYAQETATAEEVIMYLADRTRYGIGEYLDPEDRTTFQIGKGFTREDILKIVSIRYAIGLNSYQKYIPTKIATDVSDRTVAVIMENSFDLEGVSIAEDTIRRYVDSVYFSHIIGYTGKISKEEYDGYVDQGFEYSLTDVVGKAGIEQIMESDLQGVKGSETVFVDNLGKIIESTHRIEPTAGNDLYLTIDKDLQKAVYSLLEQKIAGILVSKIEPIKTYVPAPNATSSAIKIPIDDVYFALINNNIIDISNFSKNNAKEVEKSVYESFITKENLVIQTLKNELFDYFTPYSELDQEYQVYQSLLANQLQENGVLVPELIDKNSEVYAGWKNETSSLKEYLTGAIANNWIDIKKLSLDSQYLSADEIYEKLIEYIENEIRTNTTFSKKMYYYMIQENRLSGKDVCLILFEQKIIDGTDEEKDALKNGSVSSYQFMVDKISKLDITPGQLALDPCSGSCVVTDVNTGEVRALVTYPSYDNNRLANTIDSQYYAQLSTDLSKPLWDYATQQRSAPGSTYKIVSSVAALEENAISPGDIIECNGTWTTLEEQNPPKCWIAPSKHGELDIEGAIEHSCNYFFFEASYRLGKKDGVYNSEYGLEKLAYYADKFGLSETSGIEITESEPQISDSDAIRSAIGQGTNNFTTIGLARYITTVANGGTCYDLSLIDKLTDSSQRVLIDYKPKIRNQVEIKPSTWTAIHNGMRRVVLSKPYYEDLGVNVAGKTGTAQESKSRANHALFVGYAPFENPEISISTRIAFGYASDYAAELSRDVFKYYYNLEAKDDLITGTAELPSAQVTAGD